MYTRGREPLVEEDELEHASSSPDAPVLSFAEPANVSPADAAPAPAPADILQEPAAAAVSLREPAALEAPSHTANSAVEHAVAPAAASALHPPAPAPPAAAPAPAPPQMAQSFGRVYTRAPQQAPPSSASDVVEARPKDSLSQGPMLHSATGDAVGVTLGVAAEGVGLCVDLTKALAEWLGGL